MVYFLVNGFTNLMYFLVKLGLLVDLIYVFLSIKFSNLLNGVSEDPFADFLEIVDLLSLVEEAVTIRKINMCLNIFVKKKTYLKFR
jgi:hypothetical protein